MPTLVFHPGILLPIVAPFDDGLNFVSTVEETRWNVETRISATRASSWKIPAYGISVQESVAFNTRLRLHVTGWFIKYGLSKPIVYPIDYNAFVPAQTYNVEDRTSSTHNSTFNVRQRRPAQMSVKFDALTTLYSHSSVRFNALLRVYAPGFVSPSWVNQIDEPIVRPISSPRFQTPSYIEWNDKIRTSSNKMIRFNDHGKLSAFESVTFNDKATHVVCQQATAWEDLMRL